MTSSRTQVLTSAGIKKSSTKDLIYYFKIKIFFSRKNIFKLSVPFSSLEPSRKPQSSTISSLTTGSKIQSTITPSVYINPTTHNYKPNEIKSKLTSTKFNHLSGTDNRPLSMSTEWCTRPDRNNQRRDNNNKFNMENISRMNLQSTGSFVQKKIATLGSSSSRSFSSVTNAPKSILKKPNASSKLTGNAPFNKEKSMLVMSGIENVSSICVRTEETKPSRSIR
jgi:hypothetical protein